MQRVTQDTLKPLDEKLPRQRSVPAALSLWSNAERPGEKERRFFYFIFLRLRTNDFKRDVFADTVDIRNYTFYKGREMFKRHIS